MDKATRAFCLLLLKATLTNKNLINKTLHTVLNELKPKVNRHEIGTQTQKSEGTGGSVSIDY